MKKSRIISILLSLTLLIGCSGGVENKPIPSNMKTNFPSQINITSINAFTDDNGIVDEIALKEWTDYMSGLYKTNITLASYSSSKLISKRKEVENGTVTGLIDTYPAVILSLIKNDKILPIEGYLADNKVWNSLPEEYRKRFEYDGHIWAIPKSSGNQLFATSIRTDWLNTVNKQMPKTTAELFSLGEAFVNGNPDKDANPNNNYLFGSANLFWVDVLNSFGIYVNPNNATSIGYDPTQDCIVDAMFKPQAKTALQYLKDMYKAGMIDNKSFSAPSEATSNSFQGLYGSVMGLPHVGKYNVGITWAQSNSQELLGKKLDMSNSEDIAYATSIYEVMPPLVTDYPVAYTPSAEGYVLSKNTEDPNAVINAFIEMLFGSKQSYLNCFMGIPESYTDKGGNVYVSNYKKSSSEQVYNTAYLIDAPDLIFGDDYAFIYNGVYSAQAAQLYKNKINYISDYFERYSDKLVKVPVMYDLVSSTYDIQSTAIYSTFNRLMLTLSNENITVDEALKEYRENVKLYQIDTILKEANENIGKTNKQVIQ